jgi:enoyl-CoA hydratase
VIIFTGAGEKAFVVGSDLKKIQEASMVDVLNRDLRKLWTEIEQLPKPTIADVNGYLYWGRARVGSFAIFAWLIQKQNLLLRMLN